MAEFVDDFGTKLVDVHEEGTCMGEFCTIHKNSEHSMRDFKQRWRSDRALMERVCEHGVGHPDPDEIGLDESGRGVHGCDGCCLAILELDVITEAQELVVKIFKNDGVLDERQRTLGLINDMVADKKKWTLEQVEVLQVLTEKILKPND